MGRGNKSLFTGSWSHDQMAAMVKTLQKSFPEPMGRFPRNLIRSIGDSICLNVDPGMTLTYFAARSIMET